MSDNPWFNQENLNGWVLAQKPPNPEDYPILTADFSGNFHGPLFRWSGSSDDSWKEYVFLFGIKRWFSIPLPKDVFGDAVKKGYTLT